VYTKLNVVSTKADIIDLFAYFFIFMVISSIVVFCLICRAWGEKNNKYKLKAIDILVGRKETINEYYLNFQREISASSKKNEKPYLIKKKSR
jgi:hypothetical protein